jgi:hypothetical protein
MKWRASSAVLEPFAELQARHARTKLSSESGPPSPTAEGQSAHHTSPHARSSGTPLRAHSPFGAMLALSLFDHGALEGAHNACVAVDISIYVQIWSAQEMNGHERQRPESLAQNAQSVGSGSGASSGVQPHVNSIMGTRQNQHSRPCRLRLHGYRDGSAEMAMAEVRMLALRFTPEYVDQMIGEG